jgi:hypothetical protein
MQNPRVTIISQYANAPTLLQLVDNYNAYIDPAADFDNFYNLVWNVSTAQGFGLDVWGKIVNVARLLNVPGVVANFGFKEGVSYQPFGQAPLYAGPAASTVYRLSDDAYRTLIFVKALANISNCSVQSLNALLRSLFAGRGRCYVIDYGNMQMRYTFEFALLPYEYAILTQSGVVPRPAAVFAQVMQFDLQTMFGFSEANCYRPFGQGVFFNPATEVSNAS